MAQYCQNCGFKIESQRSLL